MIDFVATPLGFAILLVVAWLALPFVNGARPARRLVRLVVKLVVLAVAVRMILNAYGAARPGGTSTGTTLALLGGTLGGALLGPLLVVVVMATFYKVPKPENWDFATPMLSIAAMVVAAVVGALGGLAATRYFLEGRPLAGSIAVALSAAVVLAMPAAILSLKHLPPPKPADARARKKWARRRP